MQKNLVVFGALALAGCAQETPVDTASPEKPPVMHTVRKPVVVQQKTKFLRDFKVWSNDTGQQFRIILIPHSRVNKRDMTALGEELKHDDDQNGKYLSTFVYDNAKAARMDGKSSPEKLTDKEIDFYLRHKVGVLGKNPSTGYRAFTIYLDGFLGVEHEEIVYNDAKK